MNPEDNVVQEYEVPLAPDLKHWVELFDAAMASDNPMVQDQFRKLMMITALTLNNETIQGPFSELLKELTRLGNDVRALKNQLSRQEMTATQINDFVMKKTMFEKYNKQSPFEDYEGNTSKADQILEKLKAQLSKGLK